MVVCFFFQAEDGIRDLTVTGVQTCALPICGSGNACRRARRRRAAGRRGLRIGAECDCGRHRRGRVPAGAEIGRAAWRGRGEISVVGGSLKKKKKANGMEPEERAASTRLWL